MIDQKIVCVGYRTWAMDIYNNLRNFGIDVSVLWYDMETGALDAFYEAHNDELLNADVILWYGWSWKVPDQYLTNGKSIMLHPSPLPKYRGGSPLQNQIIHGEEVGAVTLFRMSSEVDAGNIVGQESMSLLGSLDIIFGRMVSIGTSLTVKFLSGDYEERVQNEDEATYYRRRTPKESEITVDDLLTHTAKEIHNKVRCLQHPYPLPYIRCADGTKLFLLETEVDTDG